MGASGSGKSTLRTAATSSSPTSRPARSTAKAARKSWRSSRNWPMPGTPSS
jgi:ABC-type lipoprotein export system ATPase subunit